MRRVGQAGGNGVILARGDATAGAIVIVCRERGVLTALLERVMHGDGYAWTRTGPRLDAQALGESDDSHETRVTEWIDRRRGRDPDLWVVELDIADSERFAAELAGEG